MSQTKFEKAVEIVQSLPKDGPIKPTQDDQLYVSSHLALQTLFRFDGSDSISHCGKQFYKYYKQGKTGHSLVPIQETQ